MAGIGVIVLGKCWYKRKMDQQGNEEGKKHSALVLALKNVLAEIEKNPRYVEIESDLQCI